MNVNESQVIGANDIIVSNVAVDTEKRLKITTRYSRENKKVYAFIKRFIDIIGGIVGIILLCPLTVCIFIANRIAKDNGPIFYAQERIGKDGKRFKIYKYRSMVVGAEEKLKKYLEENEEAKKEWEKNQKLKDDPRITKVGNFIRKTSIDELPQFINVLKGDMSLIGPRPVIDGEIEKYAGRKDEFLSVKPGCTGFWQANGRSNTTYDERMEMELYYVRNMSIKLDVKILFKTVSSVLKKEGAV